MISLHRSMHSSQMYTPGPAMSFLTCFWLFPQNEHFSRSESPNFAIRSPWNVSGRAPRPASRILRPADGGSRQLGRDSPIRDDVVDDAVCLGLVGRQDEVSVGVLRHLVDVLAGVLRDQLLEKLAVPRDLLRLDLDVDRLPLRTAV